MFREALEAPTVDNGGPGRVRRKKKHESSRHSSSKRRGSRSHSSLFTKFLPRKITFVLLRVVPALIIGVFLIAQRLAARNADLSFWYSLAPVDNGTAWPTNPFANIAPNPPANNTVRSIDPPEPASQQLSADHPTNDSQTEQQPLGNQPTNATAIEAHAPIHQNTEGITQALSSSERTSNDTHIATTEATEKNSSDNAVVQPHLAAPVHSEPDQRAGIASDHTKPENQPAQPERSVPVANSDSGGQPHPDAAPPASGDRSHPAHVGFQGWFDNLVKAEETGQQGQLVCPDTPERKLCENVYRFLKKLKIRVFEDISCSKNTQWIPIVLNKIASEVSPFTYICVEAESENIEEIKQSFTSVVPDVVEYKHQHWWDKDTVTPAEPQFPKLVMAWDTLSGGSYGRVYNFFASCKKANVDGVLIDNYPKVANERTGDRTYLNVKKHPFKFGQTDVVQNITFEPGVPERQLLLYNRTTLPNSLL